MTQTAQSTASDLINTDYPLTPEQVAQYQRDGFIQLNDVLTGDALIQLREAVEKAVEAESAGDNREVSQKNSYEQIFIQKVNLWTRHPDVRPFVLCRRFGNLAARLSGHATRLWHDHALFKEPRQGAKTPWHQDTHYWPHAQKKHQLSIWIALRDATTKNGCMSFLPGSHTLDNIEPVNLGNPQDLGDIAPQLKGTKARVCELKAGSATFHNGLTFHYAGPNKSDEMREAFAILYMPDGTVFNGSPHCATEQANSTKDTPLAGEMFPMVSDVALPPI